MRGKINCMLRKLLLFSVCCLPAAAVLAQTFTGGGGAIQDFQTLNVPISVSGLPLVINASDFGVERVCFNLTHTWDADLTVSLVAPDGTIVTLISNLGGSGDNMQNTCFSADAATPVSAAAAPFSGEFKPMGELGAVNNGQNPNGIWYLRVYDGGNQDQGAVQNCSLQFGNNPAAPFFTESDLPIIVINTYGQEIPDEPKIDARMGIIYNGPGAINHMGDPFNNYNNNIGIEQRGSTSGDFPQKSYGFKTRDVNETSHDTVLLNMPPEKDWILYAAYNDKSCMRNVLSYDIANKTGHYATRTRFCELVLNGQYQGIYVLMEKIKRDQERVDIATLNTVDISGDQLTGGYIIKIDRTDGPGTYWTSPHQTSSGQDVHFVYVEPKAEDIVPQQSSYIQYYMDSVESALLGPGFTDPLTGYRNFIDEASFIDYFILNEASRNVDGYRLSTFLYKDKYSNGGKLHAGPAWDYNLAWRNANYCQGESFQGWAYRFNNYCSSDYTVPFWWDRLMEDPQFRRNLKCRWIELRSRFLHLDSINAFIDANAGLLQQAQQRHFERWPILGTYIWPNPDPLATTFTEEITGMKEWIADRFAWIDANLPGICDLSVSVPGETMPAEVWPNPFDNELHVTVFLPAASTLTLRISDLTGKLVKEHVFPDIPAGEHEFLVEVNRYCGDGAYFLLISDGNNSNVIKLFGSSRQ